MVSTRKQKKKLDPEQSDATTGTLNPHESGQENIRKIGDDAPKYASDD